MVTKRVKVLLMRDVSSVGRAGTVLEVPFGFFRNFLFPRGFASLATEDHLESMKKDLKLTSLKKEKELLDSRKLKTLLQSLTVVLEFSKNEKGTLFAAVKEVDVLKALSLQGITLPTGSVSFKEPIKHVGTYSAGVELPRGITCTLKLEVR